MTNAVVEDFEVEVAPPPKWLLIVSGVLWLIITITILSFDATSAATIGYMLGFVIMLAGVAEFVVMAVAPGWKWVHGLLGVLFLVGGFMALLAPFQTFGIMALLIGWYLLVKGFFDVATSIGFRHEMPLWGLTLAVGIGEILLGFWALGYPGRSAWLLILWVGVGALMHGIGDLVAAFTRGAHS